MRRPTKDAGLRQSGSGTNQRSEFQLRQFSTGDNDTDGISIAVERAEDQQTGRSEAATFNARSHPPTRCRQSPLPPSTASSAALLSSQPSTAALVTLTFDETGPARPRQRQGWPFEYKVGKRGFHHGMRRDHSNGRTVTLTLCAAVTAEDADRAALLRSLPAASAGNLEDLAGNDVPSLTEAMTIDNVTSVAARNVITDINIHLRPQRTTGADGRRRDLCHRRPRGRDGDLRPRRSRSTPPRGRRSSSSTSAAPRCRRSTAADQRPVSSSSPTPWPKATRTSTASPSRRTS